MKKDKILLNISKISDIEKYKKLGISNFLFPLKDFSIGYEDFSLEEISRLNENVYLLINKILTDEDIDNFLKLNLPNNIKGLIIEDIGLYYALKDKNYELILFQNHLNNNYMTINFWLKHFDSLVISTDITKEEIKEITEKSNKQLVLNTFGYPMIMYSRRHLVSNYYKHYGKDIKRKIEVEETIQKQAFIFKENNFGTAVFNSKISDYRSILNEIDDNRIRFYLYFSNDISIDEMKDVINGLDIQNTTDGFLNKKTVYRIGDLK